MTRKKKKNHKDFVPDDNGFIQPTLKPSNLKANFISFNDPYKWLIFIILFFIGIAFYFDSFKNGFIWDDEMVITPNLYIRDWGHIKEIFLTDIHHFGLDKSNFYRPFQAISYMIDYSFWQLNPMGYHISSAVIHIINSFIIYLIISNIIGFLDGKSASFSRPFALGCSLIWLVHPVHTQVVTYAAGRADQLVVMFMLLSIFSFMMFEKIWISSAFFVFALLSKEYAIITPAYIFLFNYFGLSVNKSLIYKKIAPIMVILGVYLVLRVTLLNFPTDFNPDLIPGLYIRLLTSPVAIADLIKLLFLPFDLSMDRNIDWQKGFFDLRVILSVIIITGAVFLAFKTRRKLPVVFFGFIWFGLGYLPFANIIPLNANDSEHWMYLPSVGVWIVLFYTVIKVFKLDERVLYGLIIFLTIYFGSTLIARNKDFRNEIVFYNQILNRKYNNARVHYNLGCAYFYAGQENESYKHLAEAIRLKPDYAAAYGNLGQLEFRRGNLAKAIELYEKANSLKSDLVENHVNLGLAFVTAKRYQEGIDQLLTALTLNPNHVPALNNLGIAFGSLGEFDKAEKYFKLALTIDPMDVSARNNLKHLMTLRMMNPK